jgi:hypothetical protein
VPYGAAPSAGAGAGAIFKRRASLETTSSVMVAKAKLREACEEGGRK